MLIRDPITETAQRVNQRNQALIQSVTRSDFYEALRRGDAFDVELNDVAITSAAEIGLLYILNTNTKSDLYIYALYLSVGTSTGGLGVANFVNLALYINPTGGTLISGGTALTPTNRRAGSGKTAQATVKGNTGVLTVTGGTRLFKHELVRSFPFNISPFIVDVLLGPNQSMAVTYTPETGNTSQVVNLGAAFYYVPTDQFSDENV